MNKKKIAVAVALVGCTFTGGYVSGQQRASAKFSVEAELEKAQDELFDGHRAKGLTRLTDAYIKSVKNPNDTRTAIMQALAGYYVNYSVNKAVDTADEPLMKLAALQVMQNQRIIELLEQQQKTKK